MKVGMMEKFVAVAVVATLVMIAAVVGNNAGLLGVILYFVVLNDMRADDMDKL